VCCETWWKTDTIRYVAGQEVKEHRYHEKEKEKEKERRRKRESDTIEEKWLRFAFWGNVVLINERPGAAGMYLLMTPG